MTDIRTSPPPGWEPTALLRSRDLWVACNAADMRLGNHGQGPEKDPLEFETTAFWEDVFHHDLLCGFSNNSQQPPTNSSGKRCDIVTRYFDSDSQRRTLLFTEAKRANKPFEKGGLDEQELQVFGYCSDYLKAKGSQESVFACTISGPMIRCFRVDKGAKRVKDMIPLWGGGTGNIQDYRYASWEEHELEIRNAFHRMIQHAMNNMSSTSPAYHIVASSANKSLAQGSSPLPSSPPEVGGQSPQPGQSSDPASDPASDSGEGGGPDPEGSLPPPPPTGAARWRQRQTVG